MSTTLEYRIAATKASIGVKGRTLSGLAAPYSQRTRIADQFDEIIAPAAFRSVLEKSPDVVFLVNHDPSQVMGRTSAGTLWLGEDSSGLRFSCDLPDTQAAADLHTLISRGDIRGCSFGFKLEAGDQSWTNTANGPLRTIRSFSELRDVSCVTFPAYSDTTVAARCEVVAAETRAQAEVLLADWDTICRMRLGLTEEQLNFERRVAATKRAAMIL